MLSHFHGCRAPGGHLGLHKCCHLCPRGGTVAPPGAAVLAPYDDTAPRREASQSVPEPLYVTQEKHFINLFYQGSKPPRNYSVGIHGVSFDSRSSVVHLYDIPDIFQHVEHLRRQM